MKTQTLVSSAITAATLANKNVNRSSLPILECALVTANEAGSLRIATTDLDNWNYLTIDGQTTAPGSIAVPAKRFLENLKMCKGSVELEKLEKTETITQKGIAREIKTVAAFS